MARLQELELISPPGIMKDLIGILLYPNSLELVLRPEADFSMIQPRVTARKWRAHLEQLAYWRVLRILYQRLNDTASGHLQSARISAKNRIVRADQSSMERYCRGV